MLSINEAIIVEGKYDKIKLSGLVDGTIISTDGFGIFNNKAKLELIKRLAVERGVIIFTDSDRAGFLIRNYITGCMPADNIKHAYLPEVEGKERRKVEPSKEGLLGVEGVSNKMIMDALVVACPSKAVSSANGITKVDLYADGLIGRENSAVLRRRLLENMNLPSRLSTEAMVRIINALYTYEQYKEIVCLFDN